MASTTHKTKEMDWNRVVVSVAAMISGFVLWNICNKKQNKTRMKSLPHLVLHMDLNNTIIIDNLVSNLSVENTLNSILAHTFRGNQVDLSKKAMQSIDTKKDIINNKQWIALADTAEKIEIGSISYSEFIKSNLNHLKHDGIEDENFEKVKNHYLTNFTNQGFSGTQFKPILVNILSKVNSSSSFLLHQFWNMIHDLKSDKIYDMGYSSFSVVFRTFGTDSERVIQEFNQQCKSFGYHDLIIDMNDPSSHGLFIHAKEDVCLVLGTLDVPPRYDTLKEDMTLEKLTNIENMERISELKTKYDVRILKGYKEIHNFMVNTMRFGKRSVAIRDEFVFWGLNKRDSHGGKPLCLDDSNTVHSLFFDDYADVIIDSQYMNQNGNHQPISFSDIEDIHCVKCNTYEVLKDDDYFTKAIVRANLKWKHSQYAQQ